MKQKRNVKPTDVPAPSKSLMKSGADDHKRSSVVTAKLVPLSGKLNPFDCTHQPDSDVDDSAPSSQPKSVGKSTTSAVIHRGRQQPSCKLTVTQSYGADGKKQRGKDAPPPTISAKQDDSVTSAPKKVPGCILLPSPSLTPVAHLQQQRAVVKETTVKAQVVPLSEADKNRKDMPKLPLTSCPSKAKMNNKEPVVDKEYQEEMQNKTRSALSTFQHSSGHKVTPHQLRLLHGTTMEKPFSLNDRQPLLGKSNSSSKDVGIFCCVQCLTPVAVSKHRLTLEGGGYIGFQKYNVSGLAPSLALENNTVGSSCMDDLKMARMVVHCVKCQGFLGELVPTTRALTTGHCLKVNSSCLSFCDIDQCFPKTSQTAAATTSNKNTVQQKNQPRPNQVVDDCTRVDLFYSLAIPPELEEVLSSMVPATSTLGPKSNFDDDDDDIDDDKLFSMEAIGGSLPTTKKCVPAGPSTGVKRNICSTERLTNQRCDVIINRNKTVDKKTTQDGTATFVSKEERHAMNGDAFLMNDYSSSSDNDGEGGSFQKYVGSADDGD